MEGLSEWVVRSPKEVYGLMQRGALTRCTANTKMNEISSRSHAVFIIIVEQLEYLEGLEAQGGHLFKVGKLNLVDLAGSERVRLTGATGRRFVLDTRPIMLLCRAACKVSRECACPKCSGG